jgi:hypothetical protein
MDLTNAIIARSDQLNSADLIGGPQTFTVAEVRQGDAEQPVCIVLEEWPKDRPFKPSKTVLRILVLAWGSDSNDWPKGARMTLYRDESVKWAGQAVGGIRVSHLSHIKDKLKVALQESKGKTGMHTILPLPDAPTEVTAAQVADIGKGLQSLGIVGGPNMIQFISDLIGRKIKAPGDLTYNEAEVVKAEIANLHAETRAAERADTEDQHEEIPGQEAMIP